MQGYKEYYLENDAEIRKIIARYQHIKDYNVLVSVLCGKWGLHYDDVEEIIQNALAPVKKKVVNLLNRSKYKSVGITKFNGDSRYHGAVTQCSIKIMEAEGIVEIEERGGNKRMVRLRN